MTYALESMVFIEYTGIPVICHGKELGIRC